MSDIVQVRWIKILLHKDLEGFSIDINEFGEIITTYDIGKINDFLNKNVDDKKLRDRDDLADPKKGKKK
jgi:hypothetical protein